MDIKHESIADIPLIIEFCKRLNLQTVIDKALSNHGNHKGLTNGQLVLAWVAHILTQNNHCKSPVDEWGKKYQISLEALLESEISGTDFEDSRLSRLLQKLADDSTWNHFEKLFYQDSFSILQLDTSPPASFINNDNVENEIKRTIKLDATTAYGHHEVIDGGLFQRGWSKDHRPDLPQLKIMVSVEGNTGLPIASDVVPGNQNDDPLYIPILERTRNIVDTTNCLMCADSKMSAVHIRANIVINKEFYLVPLQLSNNTKKMHKELVDSVVDGMQQAELIMDLDEKNNPKLIGAGFEISREQMFKDGILNDSIEWNERVLLVRSFDHAKHEIKKFNETVAKFNQMLSKLEGKFCDSEEEAESELQKKLQKIKDDDLFKVFDFKTETTAILTEVKRAEKRNGVVRNGSFKIKKFKTRIIEVTEDKETLDRMRHKTGWRLFATNADKNCLSFSCAYKLYRKTMYVVEIGFHVLKDYINISPLFVRSQSQILGLTRLLIIALKVLKLMTAEIRANMKKENIVLTGLYPGQPARKHDAPTAQSLLEYFSRQNIALLGCTIEGKCHWHVTPLTDTCRSILRLLKIPFAYDELPMAISSKVD